MTINTKLKPEARKDDFTVKGACAECMRMGWDVFNSDAEIQRCDNCRVFINDDEALAYAVRLARLVLNKPKKRYGKRFKKILLALEIAAEKLQTSFWIDDDISYTWIRKLVSDLRKEFPDLDGATELSIAYALQDNGHICAPTGGSNLSADQEWLRENLDHEKLARILHDAGCIKTSNENWIAIDQMS